MNFELSDEQRQLQDSLARLLSDHFSFEQRRAVVASTAGRSPALWQRLAEVGITALAVPDAHGGFGGGAVDLLPVMQACGRALLLEPVLASGVLGTTALTLAADAATQQRLLPAVAAGGLQLAWAHDEAGAHHATVWTETRAVRHAGAWQLHGAKINVLHGDSAQHVVTSARVSGEPGDADGRALFLVERGATGLTCRAHRLVDDTPAAELRFAATPASPLGDPLDSAHQSAALAGTLDAGIAAACADMVGAMETAFRLAVDYMNTRQQFGRLIGENQALRHKAAEMQVSLEISRSMAIAAAVAVDQPQGDDAAADLLRAKLLIGRHSRLLCRHAIQIHGGIGMTEEYAVGHALRRVHVLDQLFGDAGAMARRLADCLGHTPPA